VAYAAVRALVASISIAKTDWNGTWMLAIFTIPISTIVAAIAAVFSLSLVGQLVLFLLFGAIQYGFIGYVVGWAAGALIRVWRKLDAIGR
jgi:hypothetical protein